MRIPFTFETKARTLEKLADRVTMFAVPDFLYFPVSEWKSGPEGILDRITARFPSGQLIVRSSAWDEDGTHWGLAGQYESVPHVQANCRVALAAAIEAVILSYSKDALREQGQDEVIVQYMLQDSVMSGVLFTHDLNTGAPYYVINYDDESGRTDTVTAGGTEYANRTLYVHRSANGAIKSPRFHALLRAVAELEEITGNEFLDVEFAVDADHTPHLFQVRVISTQANWNRGIAHRVDLALEGVRWLVHSRMRRLPGVRGSRSVFGQMPDWNPAEMIGRAPRRMAVSLYRTLITDHAWRDARAEMGYAVPAGQPLMILLAGQPYVDARLSFHSYLPADLSESIGEKLVDAWLDRLSANPHLHDKVEFDVAITAYTFDIDAKLDALVPGVLTAAERSEFCQALARLTRRVITGERGSLAGALERIHELDRVSAKAGSFAAEPTPAAIMALLEQCVRLGTVPFAVLARHGFVARSLLLSLVDSGVFTEEDAQRFSGGVRTIASEIVQAMRLLARGEMDHDAFMDRYGHLRPGTYDILSLRYDQAPEMLDGVLGHEVGEVGVEFSASASQRADIARLLGQAGFDGITPESLLEYMRAAPAAREYGKFVFTRTLSDALELIGRFGESIGLSREELSHVHVSDVLRLGVESEATTPEEHLRRLAEAGAEAHATTVATRLPQLLHDVQGVFVVPFQVSQPNFITNGVVRASCVRLEAAVTSPPPLNGRVVLIENADPGFDWIFAHQIGGLVTKFGGANSHMAIRCAEFGIPAAIGCGEQIFERIAVVGGVEMMCGERHIRPLRVT